MPAGQQRLSIPNSKFDISKIFYVPDGRDLVKFLPNPIFAHHGLSIAPPYRTTHDFIFTVRCCRYGENSGQWRNCSRQRPESTGGFGLWCLGGVHHVKNMDGPDAFCLPFKLAPLSTWSWGEVDVSYWESWTRILRGSVCCPLSMSETGITSNICKKWLNMVWMQKKGSSMFKPQFVSTLYFQLPCKCCVFLPFCWLLCND